MATLYSELDCIQLNTDYCIVFSNAGLTKWDIGGLKKSRGFKEETP